MKSMSLLLFVFIFLASCHGPGKNQGQPSESSRAVTNTIIPVFNADSAYAMVAAQLAFGPRVPGTESHKACANWMTERMNAWADTVIVQEFRTRVYTKQVFNGVNIISVFNPAATRRILLGAHWDSRPYADHDPDLANRRKPIDGANDGASGVGVLMEVARLLQSQPLPQNLGVDIIFFDLEDYGPHNDERTAGDDDMWALGSQHWARNPHKTGYKAQFGILLDMVGASGAVFPREMFSQQYAAWVLDRVWRTAQRLGYGQAFVNRPGPPINDDHLPVNRIAGIPMINIIHIDQNSSNGTFYEYWHTMNDNLSQIDPQTLKMVGDVVVHTIYEAQ